jgi:hypothetical protein
LLQGTASGEAQTLELTHTPWTTTSEDSDDAEDDEVVAACNTLERIELGALCLRRVDPPRDLGEFFHLKISFSVL